MVSFKFNVLFAFCLCPLFLIAQKKQFTPAELWSGKIPNSFLQPLPVFEKWLDDDRIVYTHKKHADSATQTYVFNIKTGKTAPFSLSKNKQTSGKMVVSRAADLYFQHNGTERKLTNDLEEEKNPTFSPDSNYIAYTKKNNLYSYNLLTNQEVQLTTDGSSTLLNGYASWVYFEEIFGRPTRYRAFWWSPDSKSLCYMKFNESKVPMFPIYNSDGQYGFLEETRYPKAGDKNPEVKIGFISADGGNTVWADFNEKDDQYFGWPIWPGADNKIWILWMNRGQDNLKIYEVNTTEGSKKEIYNEQQKTWIDLEDRVGGRVKILSNSKGFIIHSDATGYNHLYWYNMDGSLKNAITSGRYNVQAIKYIDEKNGLVYFTARARENSARSDFYVVKLEGTGIKRLTFGDYHHSSIQLSPTGKYFVTTFSNVTTPPQMQVWDTKGKFVKELGNAAAKEFSNFNIAKTEYITIKSADELFDLPAVVTWPANFDSTKKYPMLISIYGGPNAGTVWDTWNWNAPKQWLAQEGLIQVAFDHRASGHFGKAGQNFIHRNLGYWEMADYKTMAKWFINKGYADASKICITGFSYGGYISSYAVTYGADVFTHAMAGGSVVDWSLYDTHYTERFMDTPAENPQGYSASSVLTHADKLKGKLLLVHGTMDDNVHMQNSIQLLSALQDKGKDVEFMLYPGGRHGWGGAKGDHFYNLKNKFIYKYLLEKPIPAGFIK
ncbi:MAG: DPP IV N-terminal domain-containing protein [Chitinophagaceae bacterium]